MKAGLLGFLSLVATSAWATNGSQVIGASSAALSMGGTGTANYYNITEAIYRNPALLNSANLKPNQWQFDLNAQYMKINNTGSITFGPQSASQESAANYKILPHIAVAYRLDPNLSLGLGIMANGGAAADYTGMALASEQKTDLMMARVLPTVSYTVDKFSMGLTPILAYGAFLLNENKTGTGGGQSGRQPHSALAFGIQAGASFQATEMITLGLAYTSKTRLSYADITDLEAFGAGADGRLDSIIIEQPQEISFGVALNPLDNFNFTVDYRYLDWANADGTKQLGWSGQHVIAVGVQGKFDALKARLGFNYGASPVSSGSSGADAAAPGVDFQGHSVFQTSVNSLGGLSFAAAASTHITGGVGYAFSDDFGMDLAIVFVPEATITKTGNAPPALGSLAYSYATRSSQWLVGLGASLRM